MNKGRALKLATIDVGTNTTLLLVAESVPGEGVRVLADRAEITRLGRGIGGDGRLGREGIDKTLAALRTYAALARDFGASVVAVGTEALRRAPNANEFLDPAAAILGTPVEVIDGDREAGLTYQAVMSAFPDQAAGDTIVVDIGGGSTEVIVANRGTIRVRRSLPLGSVRLTERHIRHDPPTAQEGEALTKDIRQGLSGVSFREDKAASPTLIGVAGTVTSLAAMAQRLTSYDADLVHGYRMEVDAIVAEAERLARLSQADRETIPGLDPRRADVIFAGACLLVEIARAAGVTRVVVSDRGIRWGLFYERLASFGDPIAQKPSPG